jgi:pyridoxal phosphate enzyme (YggS family)
MINTTIYEELKQSFAAQGVCLVAVSKTKPASDIQALYDLGQRDFGENYVQELVEKQAVLPGDIRWHFIGHLQSNKVKMIAPFVQLIHAVDSFKLLQEIDKQAAKHNRVIDVLLQLHAAEEETKFGMDETSIIECLEYYEAQRADLQHVRICGIMGMASFTEDTTQLHQEMQRIFAVFRNLQQSYFIGRPWFNTCSMGMSSDYSIAIAEGSTMVRIGSMLFGERKKAE